MADELSDFATHDNRASDRNVAGLGLALLFLGLAAGAITALLLAPKTGKQMRRTLRRKYEDAREVFDDWGDQAGDWVDKGSDWASKAKSRSSDWADTMKDKVKPMKKAFRR